jgi:hypothetical protein
MELITKLSGLLKAITYTIRVIVSCNFKTVTGKGICLDIVVILKLSQVNKSVLLYL